MRALGRKQSLLTEAQILTCPLPLPGCADLSSYLAKIMVEDGDSAAVGSTVALLAATE